MSDTVIEATKPASKSRQLLQVVITTTGLLLLWQLVVTLSDTPAFILPAPLQVIETLFSQPAYLLRHAGVTLIEILAGLTLGCVLGLLSALIMTAFQGVRRWVFPVLVISQAIPVFALAPLLTLWLGYGMASKIAMATLIIYFPVTAAAFDGLRHTTSDWLDIAHVMQAGRLSVIRHIRLPAALPSIASGIRVATSVAPIGAVIGEWVGSSQGLGFVMLNANGRMQTDMMFAALFVLAILAITLYWLVNRFHDALLFWQVESTRSQQLS